MTTAFRARATSPWRDPGRRRAASGTPVALALTSMLLGACTVGPDYVAPAPPGISRYTPELVTSSTAPTGRAQTLKSGLDVPGQWWTLFHSRPLNALVEEALRRNPNLEAAQAALRIAQQNTEAQRGTLYPQLGAGFVGSYQKVTTDLSAPLNNASAYSYALFTPQLTVSFSPDVFGGNRRAIESLEAQAENERYQLEAAYLSLTSNVVQAAVQEASLRAQVEATRRVIAIQTDILGLVQKQTAAGQAAGADLVQQQAALAQSQQLLPPLEKALAQGRNLLTALAGRFPSEEVSQRFSLDALTLPRALPLSLPSRLVEQRPDVKAADATLHAASAGIGVAVANRLPQFTLTGNGGYSATRLAALATPGTGFWQLAGAVAQPLFDAGTLYRRQRSAEETYNQAEAQYRSTVIGALQNVADALRAIQSDGRAVVATAAAERAALSSVDLVRKQFQAGAVAAPVFLLAQQTYLQALLNHIQARTSQYSDAVALFQALGGGWWNRQDVVPKADPPDPLRLL